MLNISTIAVVAIIFSAGMYFYFNVRSFHTEIVDELIVRSNTKSHFTLVYKQFQTCRRFEKDIFLNATDPNKRTEYTLKFTETAENTFELLTSLNQKVKNLEMDSDLLHQLTMVIKSFNSYKSAVLQLAESDETSPTKLNLKMESSKDYIYTSEEALSALSVIFDSYLEHELWLVINEVTIIEEIVLAISIISAIFIAVTLALISTKIKKGLSLFQNKLSGMSTHITEITPVEWNQTDEFREFSETINNTIAKHKELKHRLHQSEKMEAMGTLAGGIAHDFNNILSAVLGASSLLKESMRSDEELRLLDCIEQSIKKTVDLNLRLLRFSRESGEDRENLHLNEVIEDSIPLIKHSRSGSVQIEFDRKADADLIFGNYAEIQTVLLNLGINARDAIQKDNGFIKITTKTLRHDGSSWIQCSITDNGYGIEQEIINKIFDPFFTTKPKEEGTGLGLSAVYGIIKEHEGEIRVESTQNKGTCFTFKFPLQISDY